MAKKFEFYDIRHLLKDYPKAYYYVVFGERSNGKTYSALDYAWSVITKTVSSSPMFVVGARTSARRTSLPSLMGTQPTVESNPLSRASGQTSTMAPASSTCNA